MADDPPLIIDAHTHAFPPEWIADRVNHCRRDRWFGDLYGLHPMDAYQLLSQITEVPIANVVDANYSAVVKARKSLLPAAAAYGGLHDDLRARAATLR